MAVDSPACKAPAELVSFGPGLPHLSQAIAAGEPVRIVALGSSSTEGAGASSKKACYPARLQAQLRSRFPDQPIEVVNLGIGGELASDMVERIEKDVLKLKPQLVIWQTGVNDALRGIALDAFRGQVRAGLKLLREGGADVVLLDQQYYPKSAKLPAYLEFVASMRDISRTQKVPILRRYEIMRHLVSSAQYEIGDLLARDHFHQSDEGYRCLGKVMADAIEASVRRGGALRHAGEEPKLQNASASAAPSLGR